MEELQNQLLLELNKLITHLEKYNVSSWVIIFKKIESQIDNGNRLGIDALKNMRGGMGSFTDLVISAINGHNVKKEEENQANNQLMLLSNSVFTTVDKLNRLLNKKSV